MQRTLLSSIFSIGLILSVLGVGLSGDCFAFAGKPLCRVDHNFDAYKKSVVVRQPVARRWDVLDMVMEVAKVPPKPFDIELTASFAHSSGQELTVHGFYNGGNQYLIRFTPPLAGEWTY